MKKGFSFLIFSLTFFGFLTLQIFYDFAKNVVLSERGENISGGAYTYLRYWESRDYETLGQKRDGFQGKEDIVVVNLWANWCAPCIEELPYLNKVNTDPRIKVILITAYSGDELQERRRERSLILRKQRELAPNLSTLISTDSTFFFDLPSQQLPQTYIYKNGRLIKIFYYLDELQSFIKTLN